MLKMLVFCHRHSKNDPFLLATPVDFSIVREPMYKYSKVAQDRFFENPAFAYLFCFFMKDKSAQKFAAEKFSENEDKSFATRMADEMA